MFVVKYKKIFLIISLLLILASFVLVFTKGLNVGIDFTGGSVLEVTYIGDRPAQSDIESAVSSIVSGEFSVRPTGEDGYSIKAGSLSDEGHKNLLSALPGATEKKFTDVGPTVGHELKNKAIVALLIVILLIVLFVAFAFRKVSKPISSWWYGLIVIVALVHDVIIPVGIFALFHFDVDILFITALLAILGYSVNDTIVVFDRIRENLKHNHDYNLREDFELTVGKSLSQTFGRSINTSFTTLIALIALFIFGGVAVHTFALALGVGVIAGAYSSIFLASPLLVYIAKWKNKKA